jgi:hypothetical protein
LGGEGIIAAAVGALAGGGGVRAIGRMIGPERESSLTKYHREVIDGLVKENTVLRRELTGLRDRVVALELAQDDPPPHMS